MAASGRSALTITLPSDREIMMTRVFDAPRALVWRAYTDPGLIPRWWGPRYLTTTVDRMDVRPGGVWRFIQRDADGKEDAFNGVYRDIVPPARLVQTFEWEGLPGHILVETATFEEQDGKTTVTSVSLFDSREDRDGMLQSGMETGATESNDRMAEVLEELKKTWTFSGQELVITRIFDAPRDLVWKAWTTPEIMAKWWGPKDFTAPTVNIDLRVGCAYLYCMRSPDGQDFWSTGVYKEIVPPERLVVTDSFADAQGNVVSPTQYGMGPDFPQELQVTVIFEDFGGKTRMTLRHVGMPAGPMSEMAGLGWNESFDKLAEVMAGS